jgi:hypothetical protein
VSRGWMRLISDDPEFSWSGTIFIVIAFTVAGLGHGVAWATRATGGRRWSTVARWAGAVLTLPLFVGAGALMLPTVIAGSLARWRTDWAPWARAVAVVLAVPAPVGVAVGTLRHGPTVGRVAGIVLFAATYATIVAGLRAVVAPAADRRRMRRWARVVTATAVVLLLLAVAFFAVGVATA